MDDRRVRLREPAEAVRLCQRALDVARAQGDADLELCSLSGLGEKLVMAGQLERGLALIDEAMAGTLGGERSRLDTVAYTCCDMLVACDLAADLERARQWCQVADRFIAYGCPFWVLPAGTLYGSVLVATGHWAAGERELLRAVEMGAGAGPARRQRRAPPGWPICACARDASRRRPSCCRGARRSPGPAWWWRCAWPRATRPAPRPSCGATCAR